MPNSIKWYNCYLSWQPVWLIYTDTRICY